MWLTLTYAIIITYLGGILMNDLTIKDNSIIEDMIYEVRGMQVMLASKVAAIKYHGYIYDKMITHYVIGETISVFHF